MVKCLLSQVSKFEQVWGLGPVEEGGRGSQMNKFEEFQGMERGTIPMLVGRTRLERGGPSVKKLEQVRNGHKGPTHCEQMDMTENITFPKLRWSAVTSQNGICKTAAY